MTPNFIQEQLSWAYVRAAMFRAGYNLSRPGVDNYGIGGSVVSIISEGTGQVDFQLKSSTRYDIRDEHIIYDLNVENYNQLTGEDALSRVLVLFTMSASDNLWLSQSHYEMCLRKCAYWVSLMGMPRSRNSSTVRISVPRANVFDENGLRSMFNELI